MSPVAETKERHPPSLPPPLPLTWRNETHFAYFSFFPLPPPFLNRSDESHFDGETVALCVCVCVCVSHADVCPGSAPSSATQRHLAPPSGAGQRETSVKPEPPINWLFYGDYLIGDWLCD